MNECKSCETASRSSSGDAVQRHSSSRLSRVPATRLCDDGLAVSGHPVNSAQHGTVHNSSHGYCCASRCKTLSNLGNVHIELCQVLGIVCSLHQELTDKWGAHACQILYVYASQLYIHVLASCDHSGPSGHNFYESHLPSHPRT